MNWDYTGTKSYVDVIPPSPIFNPNLTYERSSYWPAPPADARLQPGILRQPCSSEQLRPGAQQFGQFQAHGPGSTQANTVLPSQRVPFLQTSSLPPVEPAKQLASTPEIHQGTNSPASSHNTPAIQQSDFTPPNPSAIPGPQSRVVSLNTNMADPSRFHGQQRPLMGPPETPSRVMQASPTMFPTLQFSPDLFSTQSMGPVSAPIYPQQRLFWDQSVMPEQHMTDQFQTPYSNNFDGSFHSSSTVVPNYSPAVSQGSGFDLPQQAPPQGSFLDTTAFPMPFQTSPRPPPPAIENPTQFLSSPARRFGGSDMPTTSSFMRPARDLPAYHHQIEESRRERELERRKTRSAAKRAEGDLIMSSVRRALSPSKTIRPGLKRSVTYSGVATNPQHRRTSRVSINDSASASSVTSEASSRNGRQSPLKTIRHASSSSHLRSGLSQKARTAMSLAIDENGVAKTILRQLPESDDDMDMDNDAQSVVSSADEGDFNMIRSQNTSFAFDDDEATSHPTGRHSEISRSGATSRLQQDGHGRVGFASLRGMNRGAMHSDAAVPTTAGRGDAQKALRAIIEDRSRSVSAQGGYSSSRQSDSSVQFHSSPPVQQNQFGDLSGSPTTITDPDLATPSTDQDSYGGLGATRCICNSMSPDGSTMIQCDSCAKWLHAKCIGFDKRRPSDVYICVYCEHTPVRHPSNRGSIRSSTRGSTTSASPLAHKSVRPNRGR